MERQFFYERYFITVNDLLIRYAQAANQKIFTTQSDLNPKDYVLPEMRAWCEREGHSVVMHSGIILSSQPGSRAIQNCKTVLLNKGIRPGKVIPASQDLINVLIANANAEHTQEKFIVDSVGISVQQQRLRMLVKEALQAQVTDIHIEVRQETALIRFRKHGDLYLHAEWLPHLAREVASVAFNKETDHSITHFNPSVPQNAAMPILIDGQEVRLRLASLPAQGGFDVVMRVLTAGFEKAPTLQELGYLPHQVELIQRAIRMPYGAVLISGPTGSGKTTTLASCMAMVENDRKIYTIEDPVEKLIDNATQVPVNTEKDDRDFASMARTALRMDPDVIVLGEMRDEDTVRVLIRAAITGHLVFSTLHTNTAPAIVTRLIDIGVSPILLGDNHLLVCLICQRLIPILCEHCAIPVEKSSDHQTHLKRWRELFGKDFAHLKARGSDCEHCHGTGIKGRTVVAEIIWVDSEGRKFVQQGDTLGWEKYLRANGWQSYRDHALELARTGICDPLDVEKITGIIDGVTVDKSFDYKAHSESLKK